MSSTPDTDPIRSFIEGKRDGLKATLLLTQGMLRADEEAVFRIARKAAEQALAAYNADGPLDPVRDYLSELQKTLADDLKKPIAEGQDEGLYAERQTALQYELDRIPQLLEMMPEIVG